MGNVTDRRFVAHLDMLGMSPLSEADPDLAWEALSKLALSRHQTMTTCPVGLASTGELVRDYVHSFIFSDTIIMFSRGESDEDLCAMTVLVAEVFKDALHASIPLRGAVALGRFKFNDLHGLFAGPALVEAHRLGEGSQWLGVVLSDEVADRIHKSPVASRGIPKAVRWDLPTKSGPLPSWVLNWPEIFRRNLTLPPPITPEQFFQAFVQLFGPFDGLEEKDQRKYRHTVEFVNERLRPQ